jgi:serine/threonine protein kinase
MAVPMLIGITLVRRYRVDALIGTGGYATVYRVTDLQQEVDRALKEVADPDPAIREQFALEAQLLMTSNHPNIPHGYEHFEENGRAYLVMDYVGGRDLEQLLSESLERSGRPLDEEKVLRWLMPICDALEVMHTRVLPIIHRDIKPANIKLNAEGTPILIDFGLAKLYRPGPTNQAAQGVTPGYAPPEQYLALGKTDPRSDVYAMGATLYTLLTGREPPEAPNRLLAQSPNSGEPLVPARMVNPSISPATARIIDRAMNVTPNLRQQSARELRDDMQAALNVLLYGRPPMAGGDPPTTLLSTLAGVPAPIPSEKQVRPYSASVPAPPALTVPRPRLATPPQPQSAPLFNLGGPLVKGMGKLGILLAAIEILWGLLCAGALGAVVGTHDFTRAPSIPVLAAGAVWVGAVIALTVLLVRAIDRPLARRGRLSGARRWLQGIFLSLIFLAVNGIAYRVLGTASAQEGLIGLGLLGLGSIMVGLLSAANILG